MVIEIGMVLLLMYYVLSSNNRFKLDFNHKVLGIKEKNHWQESNKEQVGFKIVEGL